MYGEYHISVLVPIPKFWRKPFRFIAEYWLNAVMMARLMYLSVKMSSGAMYMSRMTTSNAGFEILLSIAFKTSMRWGWGVKVITGDRPSSPPPLVFVPAV